MSATPPLIPGAPVYRFFVAFFAAFLVAFFFAAFFLAAILQSPLSVQIWTPSAPLFNISGDKGLYILGVA
jgi:hypothetical protein